MKLIKYTLLSLIFTASFAFAKDYAPGKGYELISSPQPILADGRIHVEEIFWFGCPHCFTLEPSIEKWKAGLADNVAFSKMPASFNKTWATHAQLFYTIEALGLAKKLNSAVFKAIHVNKQRLASQEEQRDFIVANSDVSAEKFDRTYRSFSVKSQMKRADKRIRNYQITGVPAVVVNGKYLVSVSTAGSEQEFFNVLNYLIKSEQ